MEVILAVLSLVLLFLGYESVKLQEGRGKDVTAIQWQQKVQASQQRAIEKQQAAIQRQRAITATESCGRENARHEALQSFLEKQPSFKNASKKERVVFEQFVDALVPHEDCHRRALEVTGRIERRPRPKPTSHANSVPHTKK